MRKIISEVLVDLSTVGEDKSITSFDEAERLLKSKMDYCPVIGISGHEKELYLSLDNLKEVRSAKNVVCYLTGTIEKFTKGSELRQKFYSLEMQCINNIKEQLLRIHRPVDGEELEEAGKFSEGFQHTSIRSIFLDANWDIFIEHENGELQYYHEAVEKGHITYFYSVGILEKLEKVSMELVEYPR